MTFKEFNDKVFDELERNNFPDVIRYYNPPIIDCAFFMHEMMRAFYFFGEQNVERCAAAIQTEFESVAKVVHHESNSIN